MSFLEAVACLAVIIPWWGAIAYRLSAHGWRRISRHLTGFVVGNLLMSICLMLIGGSPFGWGWLLVVVAFILGGGAWANASEGRSMFDDGKTKKPSAPPLPSTMKLAKNSPETATVAAKASTAEVSVVIPSIQVAATPRSTHANTNAQSQQKLAELRQFAQA
ncbi:hypothetical protein [Chromobacterium sphagni]|uniref:hypothetical protein n=1 Tax=Chromobacterium sphagni TaxID=1903179 RepID=UPI001113360D|nr:hypothetical protein [Chromobacterium sphagni]